MLQNQIKGSIMMTTFNEITAIAVLSIALGILLYIMTGTDYLIIPSPGGY
jgi:hypothetical protein